MLSEISFPLFEPQTPHPRVRPVFLCFHGCPGKCIYCAQNLQSGVQPEPLEAVYSRLQHSLQSAADHEAPPFEIAFYGGTFTRLPPPWPQRFTALGQEFREQGLVSRIRCSTRPDALNTEQLLELKTLGLDCIELGVQTFSDRVLSLSRRGYTGDQATKACERVLKTGLALGIQLLPGLPGHTPQAWLEDIQRTIGQHPALVRLYPCLVLKGTPLQRLWSSGAYQPWTLQETRQALNRGVFRLFRAGIPVTRIGLAPEPELLDNVCAGPWHPALGSIIKSRILFAVLLFQALRLGPGPKRLFCPKYVQGRLFGHQGRYLNRLQRIGIQPADVHFQERTTFKLQLRNPKFKEVLMNTNNPNILLIQADQFAAPALGCYGNQVLDAPHLDSLAEDGVVFESAYCNNPLCAPSRFSMMSGRQTSRIAAYDNAAEFPGDIPTFAHYLRANGYQTCLAGKMHFVGADQLHGFEERLTTDVYPADHGWTPDWEHPEHRFDWWYHNMSSVTEAGPCERTKQIDFDDETGFRAVRKIYNLARSDDPRPFCLTVSFTDPHDPYACPKSFWDRYEPKDIPLPRVRELPQDAVDPHSRRLRAAYQADCTAITEQDIINARRAYFGQISYIDDKIGRLLKALDDTGLRENTIILFTADHGDMLGERGLWYKMSLFEWSVRIPLLINAPARFRPRRIATPVSLVDLLPTFLDFSSDPRLQNPAAPLDGTSLIPLLEHGDQGDTRTVIAEFLGEGAIAPCFMVRQGAYKYIYSQPDPPQLYHLEADPDELDNLAGRKESQEVQEALHAALLRHQDPVSLHEAVLASQKRRRLVYQAHMQGRHTPWDFHPVEEASQKYMRNHLDLNVVEGKARIASKP